MKRKIFAVIITICMVTMLSLPVFATAAPAEAPQGVTEIDCGACGECTSDPKGTCSSPTTVRPSLGSSRVRSNGGEDWLFDGDGSEFGRGDDSDQTNRPFSPGTDPEVDISVWARIVQIGAETKIYCVDIEWGHMKFIFERGYGTWDPDTLTYDSADTAEWRASYIDADNNKVLVRNRSNDAIDAAFDFDFEGGNENLFNAATVGDDRVEGNFFLDNSDALEAATFLTDAEMSDIDSLASFVDEPLKVDNADTKSELVKCAEGASCPTTVGDISICIAQDNKCKLKGEEQILEVYFAFSGTPTKEELKTDHFQKVGVITVTITPHVEP